VKLIVAPHNGGTYRELWIIGASGASKVLPSSDFVWQMSICGPKAPRNPKVLRTKTGIC